MERHDYFLLATTATCAALAVASFVIMLGPSLHYAVPKGIFDVLMAPSFLHILWCLGAMPYHICMLLQRRPPQELFSDGTVVLHWILTAESLVYASAGVCLVYSHRFLRSSCGGSSVCRSRFQLSSWLALAMAALSVVDALLLRWATRRTHCAAQPA